MMKVVVTIMPHIYSVQGTVLLDYMDYLIESSQSPPSTGTIIPILQIRKRKHREVKSLPWSQNQPVVKPGLKPRPAWLQYMLLAILPTNPTQLSAIHTDMVRRCVRSHIRICCSCMPSEMEAPLRRVLFYHRLQLLLYMLGKCRLIYYSFFF